MPENGNNNDMEGCSEDHFNITNKYIENERPYNESKNVVDEPVNKVKTETNEVVVVDKDTYKDLGTEYKKEKIK